MQIRLVPPSHHPTILYSVSFPNVLPLHQLGPGATIPAAWSSQLQLLTSFLNFEPPSSIHMLDRAVGLVARVQQLSMDIPQKEITVTFVDGREVTVPMNSDCVRMLLDVVDDVQGCSEAEDQRNSMEGSASAGSTVGGIEDVPSGGSPSKSPKFGKHKRQRSLLFSLISSLVPKSLSSPPPSPPPPTTGPPRVPLPSLPIFGRVTSPPSSPQQASFPPAQPDFLRRRARATIIDVWRRHVIPALTPQHQPAAGYVEWTLIAFARRIRAEIDSVQTIKSRDYGISSSTRPGGSKHKRTQSEGRNALDFGDRDNDCELEQWRYRSPSPFPDVFGAEDTDQVVYPRRQQLDEWGIQHGRHSDFSDKADVFMAGFNSHNDSLLREPFTISDNWDDDQPLAFQLGHVGHHGWPGIATRLSGADEKHLHLDDFPMDCGSDDCNRLADMAFDMSRCPLTPSDVNDDEESDDSQISLRTPEDGEDLSSTLPGEVVQHFNQHVICPVPQSPLVSRASSSRPRPRPRSASAQFPNAFPKTLHPPTYSMMYSVNSRDTLPGEYVATRLDYLERACGALDVVRSRAREEGWRLVRATSIGAKNGWMDTDTERSLEIKAKRRAWSSGVKISAVCPTLRLAVEVWDGRSSTFGSLMRPPGLNPSLRKTPQVREPIVPTGLSLGRPLRSSPLALFVWSADDEQMSTLSKHSVLDGLRTMETIEGKRLPRMSLTSGVTKLFPVSEDESEVSFEPVEASAVGFPQAVPLCISAEHDYGLMEGFVEHEDDLLYLCPSRPQPRVRTTSMHPSFSTPLASSTPVLPMFRPSTPPPSYRVAVGGDTPVTNEEQGSLDASALLLQPLSSFSVSSPQPLPSQHPPTSNPTFTPRPRSVSLPTPKSFSGPNKTRRTSFHHKDEHFEDLSRAYASPPPEGPLVVPAAREPQEEFPRYAHIHSPTPTSKKNITATILGKEMVFEQGGSEFAVGIEVALGRAEEGRVVW